MKRTLPAFGNHAASGRTSAVTIGGYVHRSWPRRHRWLFFVALMAFAVPYGFAITILSQALLLQLAAPLVVLIAVALWIAPDMDWAPEKALARLLGAYLIALFCWPDYMAIALPGLPWITVLRLVGLPLTITLLLCVSLSADFRAQLAAILSAEPWIWRLFVAFTAIAFLSIFLSNNVFTSVNRFVVAQLNWTVPFLAAAILFTRTGRLRRFAYILWGAALLNCAIGVWEAHYEKVPWAGHIPWFLRIEDESVLRTLAGNYRSDSDAYRITTRFGVPLTLGEFLGMMTPFLLHLMATTKRIAVCFAGFASLPLLFYVVLNTGSRLGFICFVMSLMLYGMAATYLWWQRERNSIVPAAILFAYPAGMLAFFVLTFAWQRLRGLVWGIGMAQISTNARSEMYDLGIPMVLRNPLGYGIGQGASTLGWRTPSGLLTIDTYYLSILLEYGVLGFIIYYGMFAYAVCRAIWIGLHSDDAEVRYLIPASIVLIDFIVSKSVLSQQENHPLAFIVLGITVALSYRHSQKIERVPRRTM